MHDGRHAVWVDDPNPIFRRGIVSCLSSAGLAVAGESAGLCPEPELSAAAVLLFDAESVGVWRAARLARCHDVRLVGVVGEARAEALFDGLTAGLAGVLVRGELTPTRLTSCLSAVVEGNGATPPELLQQMLVRLSRGAPRGAASASLTRREVDVLRLLADGDSTREIADRLAYSERTVKNVVHDLLVKLDCRTRAHAVARATRQGVI